MARTKNGRKPDAWEPLAPAHYPPGSPPAMEPVENGGLHRITARADGPDLHDLVRLIEYLREHVGHVNVGQPQETYDVYCSWTPRPLPGGNNDRRPESVMEGHPHRKGGVFVGPDGTVYDANREAL